MEIVGRAAPWAPKGFMWPSDSTMLTTGKEIKLIKNKVQAKCSGEIKAILSGKQCLFISSSDSEQGPGLKRLIL